MADQTADIDTARCEPVHELHELPIARLRELLSKATPGPWIVWGPAGDPSAADPLQWQHIYEIRVDDGGKESWPTRLAATPVHMVQNGDNYALIAALRNAAPALLDTIDAKAARIAALESDNADLADKLKAWDAQCFAAGLEIKELRADAERDAARIAALEQALREIADMPSALYQGKSSTRCQDRARRALEPHQ